MVKLPTMGFCSGCHANRCHANPFTLYLNDYPYTVIGICVDCGRNEKKTKIKRVGSDDPNVPEHVMKFVKKHTREDRIRTGLSYGNIIPEHKINLVEEIPCQPEKRKPYYQQWKNVRYFQPKKDDSHQPEGEPKKKVQGLQYMRFRRFINSTPSGGHEGPSNPEEKPKPIEGIPVYQSMDSDPISVPSSPAIMNTPLSFMDIPSPSANGQSPGPNIHDIDPLMDNLSSFANILGASIDSDWAPINAPDEFYTPFINDFLAQNGPNTHEAKRQKIESPIDAPLAKENTFPAKEDIFSIGEKISQNGLDKALDEFLNNL